MLLKRYALPAALAGVIAAAAPAAQAADQCGPDAMSAYKIRLADGSLMKVSIANVNARGRAPYAEGDAVWLSWPADAGILLTS